MKGLSFVSFLVELGVDIKNAGKVKTVMGKDAETGKAETRYMFGGSEIARTGFTKNIEGGLSRYVVISTDSGGTSTVVSNNREMAQWLTHRLSKFIPVPNAQSVLGSQ
jgi:hypothetical protein